MRLFNHLRLIEIGIFFINFETIRLKSHIGLIFRLELNYYFEYALPLRVISIFFRRFYVQLF